MNMMPTYNTNAKFLIEWSLSKLLEYMNIYQDQNSSLIGKIDFYLDNKQINIDIEGLNEDEKSMLKRLIQFDDTSYPNIGIQFSLILLSQLYKCQFHWELYAQHNVKGLFLRISKDPSKLTWYDTPFEAKQGQDGGYIMKGDGEGNLRTANSYSIPEGL